MSNKRFNHQTAPKLGKGKSPGGNEHSTAMRNQWGRDTDPMPGLPGKAANPFPASFGKAEDVAIYPHRKGV